MSRFAIALFVLRILLAMPTDELFLKLEHHLNATLNHRSLFDFPLTSLGNVANKSFVNFGDTVMVSRLVDKLSMGQCITVVAIGGSVTCGAVHAKSTHADRPFGVGDAWPTHLITMLNQHYPCSRREEGHVMHNLCSAGMSSAWWLEKTSDPDFHQTVLQADLLIVDTATNDIDQLVSNPTTNKPPPAIHHRKGLSHKAQRHAHQKAATALLHSVPRHTELLISIFLHLPNHPALIYVCVSTRMMVNFNRTAIPRKSDAVHLQLPVAMHYGVPYVSVVDGVWPLSTTQSLEWFKTKFLADNCCHVTKSGHRLIATLVMGLLQAHEMELSSFTPNSSSSLPVKPILLPPPWETPRKLLYATASEIDFYTMGVPLHIPTTAAPVPYLTNNVSFSIYEDVPHKPGLISSEVGAMAIFIINATESARHIKFGHLHVIHLKSYEHMGHLQVQVSLIKDGVSKLLSQAIFDALWDERVSEPQMDIVQFDIRQAKGSVLMVNLSVTASQRPENKVKIIKLVLY